MSLVVLAVFFVSSTHKITFYLYIEICYKLSISLHKVIIINKVVFFFAKESHFLDCDSSFWLINVFLIPYIVESKSISQFTAISLNTWDFNSQLETEMALLPTAWYLYTYKSHTAVGSVLFRSAIRVWTTEHASAGVKGKSHAPHFSVISLGPFSV